MKWDLEQGKQALIESTGNASPLSIIGSFRNKKTTKLIVYLGIFLSIFGIFKLFDFPDSNVLQLPTEYWTSKAMDHVEMSKIKEAVFNSTEFVERYADDLGIPAEPNKYAALSGAIVMVPKNKYTPNGYIHIARVIQLRCDQPYEDDGTARGACLQQPMRSFVYGQFLNTDLVSIDQIHKGIRYPLVYEIDAPDVDSFPGPEDSRITLDPWQNAILSFNMADRDQNSRRKQWTYNVTSGALKLLRTDLGMHQKNWVPFFKDNKLHHVYSWSPFVILDCKRRYANCKKVENSKPPSDADHQSIGNLRGGSALVPYGSYYVATARTRQLCGSNSNRVYRPHFVVLNSDFELVYVSEYLEFNSAAFIAPIWNSFKTPEVVAGAQHTKMVTTLGLTPSHQPGDWIAEITVNDQKNVLITLSGFSRFLDGVIGAYERNSRNETIIASANLTGNPIIPNLTQLAEEQSKGYCAIYESK